MSVDCFPENGINSRQMCDSISQIRTHTPVSPKSDCRPCFVLSKEHLSEAVQIYLPLIGGAERRKQTGGAIFNYRN